MRSRKGPTVAQLLTRIEQVEKTVGLAVREFQFAVKASEQRTQDRLAGAQAAVQDLTGALLKAVRVPRDVSPDFEEAQAAARLRNKRGKRARRR